jgi:hypothetical protein
VRCVKEVNPQYKFLRERGFGYGRVSSASSGAVLCDTVYILLVIQRPISEVNKV